MLETIRSEIQALPTKSFPEYFQEYVMAVQDDSISAEISALLKHNQMDIVVLSKVIKQNYERMIQYDSK